MWATASKILATKEESEKSPFLINHWVVIKLLNHIIFFLAAIFIFREVDVCFVSVGRNIGFPPEGARQ